MENTIKRHPLHTLIFSFIFIGVGLVVGYSLLTTWMNNEITKSYAICKDYVSQTGNVDFASRNSKIQLVQCTMNDFSEKYSFIGKQTIRDMKSKLEMEVGL